MRGEPDIGAFLNHLPLFQGLSGAEIGRLAEGTARRRLRAGETLFREGEPSTGVHAVVHGRIALTVRGPAGRERVSDIIGAGRSFGEAIMFRDKPYIVSAKALSDSLVLHVAKATVFAELERNPRFARRIIAALSAKLWLLRAARPGASGTASVTLPASKRAVALEAQRERGASLAHPARARRRRPDRGRRPHGQDPRPRET